MNIPCSNWIFQINHIHTILVKEPLWIRLVELKNSTANTIKKILKASFFNNILNSSSETKWQRMNGLVLQLPHGYEGQGPEHSSARIERFMTLCADNNMYILNCTTPANLFHALRRQTARPFRKPLVIFTPKSLLRHQKCISSLTDFEKGTCFQEVIDDHYADPSKVKRVLFCNGKTMISEVEGSKKPTFFFDIRKMNQKRAPN